MHCNLLAQSAVFACGTGQFIWVLQEDILNIRGDIKAFTPEGIQSLRLAIYAAACWGLWGVGEGVGLTELAASCPPVHGSYTHAVGCFLTSSRKGLQELLHLLCR